MFPSQASGAEWEGEITIAELSSNMMPAGNRNMSVAAGIDDMLQRLLMMTANQHKWKLVMLAD